MQARCSHCAGNHLTSACPYRSGYDANIAELFHQPKRHYDSVTAPNPEAQDFVPLRKVLKRASTGQEDNFMFNYYSESPEISKLNDEEIRLLRREYSISVAGGAPKPIRYFEDLMLPPELMTALATLGVEMPTPIQMQALPAIMQGRDVIGNAETGSGKTLAYLLPLFMLLRQLQPAVPGQGVTALILAPTRELVEQIWNVTNQLLAFVQPTQPLYASVWGSTPQYRTLGVVGGVPVNTQLPALRDGIDVLVATPGRLLDLMDRNAVIFDRLYYLVLDECDEMLRETGMEAQLRKIVSFANICPRQTLLFSATYPTAVERIARSAVMNPLHIRIGSQKTTANAVSQRVIFVPQSQKKQKLLDTLRSIPKPPVLVFCNTHFTVDTVVDLLRKEQFHAAGFHKDKAQTYRFSVIHAFKEGKLDVLVATGLAARGLDIVDVTHVVMYDIPARIEDYIHRAGRTGRAGRVGAVTAFLTYECRIASQLRELLEQAGEEIPREMQNLRMLGRDSTNDT